MCREIFIHIHDLLDELWGSRLSSARFFSAGLQKPIDSFAVLLEAAIDMLASASTDCGNFGVGLVRIPPQKIKNAATGRRNRNCDRKFYDFIAKGGTGAGFGRCNVLCTGPICAHLFTHIVGNGSKVKT